MGQPGRADAGISDDEGGVGTRVDDVTMKCEAEGVGERLAEKRRGKILEVLSVVLECSFRGKRHGAGHAPNFLPSPFCNFKRD